ncbi:HhH-GPD superfamily base excision DNA repair protein [Apiospora phragmitis]|uniref:HhH-GPD superfamily base excision DNA repair protein n=1 Tax=Apiospora phragmitis TaxID=2905665 RepID=A0ABR1TQM4_9PEZI
MSTRRSARLSAAAEAKPLAEAIAPPPSAAPKSRKRKAAAGPAVSKEGGSPTTAPEVAAPSTPNKRRPKARIAEPPPATPTPSNAKLIGEPAALGTTPKPKPAAVRRLADPNATNATLLSPETSRVVASKEVEFLSPTKSSGVKATTANILDEACTHLIKIDPRMEPLIKANHCRVFSPEGLTEKIDPFESLCSGIISQQVSGAAAKAIKQRFVGLFFDDTSSASDANTQSATTSGRRRFPHPSQVAATKLETLRTAGLSQRKAEYIQGLAEKFAAGELSAQMLADAPYEEVLEKLTAVRGLGRWSVEMFACFALKRMDVFSLGDLGVQRGMAAFVGRDIAKLKASKGGKWKYMSEKEMEEIAARFTPYRSVFMWYMWRVEETDVSTME